MMNYVEVQTIKEINNLLDKVLLGKVEHLPELRKAKELATDMIEFKDIDAWKLVQD